ncbi:MAG: isocitrate/isopropylmalate family dehydrogenase [Candidatus Bipolaricaulia bacterium]
MADPHQVAVIPGDGVGPEVVEAAVGVLEASPIPLEVARYDAGDSCRSRHGVALPEATLAGARAADAVLFGAAGQTGAEVILRLRRELETYVNLRPIRALSGIDGLYSNVEFVIVRENSEGLYAGLESEVAPGVTTATRVTTERASNRIARFAFRYASENGHGKVTAVHKANVLQATDGLFLRCARDVAEDYSDIAYDEAIVDAAALHLVTQPERFDVIVTTNLFGDILSDLSAGLIGGLGLCPSANLGERHALFEPVHGTAPDIAGKEIANPTAAILCGAMLARHLGYRQTGEHIEQALENTLMRGVMTPDLGGSRSTPEMTEDVVAHLEEDST